MKIRNGFVSNSSSSSFLLIAKPGIYSIKEEVEKALILPEDNIWHSFSKEAAERLWEQAEEITKNKNDPYDEFTNILEELPKDQQEYILNGGNLFCGFFWDEDPGIDRILCDLEINYENNRIIIQKDEGY